MDSLKKKLTQAFIVRSQGQYLMAFPLPFIC